MRSSSSFAEKTTVTPERSQAEIMSILRKYGATKFVNGFDETHAYIMFELSTRRVRFELPLPDISDFEYTDNGRARKRAQMISAHEQEIRRRWRALALVIKAKLEAVSTGIVSFDAEFLAHLVLPDRSTIGERMLPRLDDVVATGKLPPMLGSGS